MSRIHPADVIAAMGRLLTRPENFCQGAVALDEHGYPTEPVEGCKWDVYGAAYLALGLCLDPEHEDGREVRSLAQALAYIDSTARTELKSSPTAVNDEQGHAAVLDLLRRAWLKAKRNHVEESEPEKRKAA